LSFDNEAPLRASATGLEAATQPSGGIYAYRNSFREDRWGSPNDPVCVRPGVAYFFTSILLTSTKTKETRMAK
jgi:hypothetical protein